MDSSLPPMPHPDNLLRYKRSDAFAFCRRCLTHLSLLHSGEDNSQNIALLHNQCLLFKDAVNLRLDEVHEIRDGATTVRAYCKNCGEYLGVKLVSLPFHDDMNIERKYYLNGLKMLVWFNNKIWYAHTRTEIENIAGTAMAEHVLFGFTRT